MMLIWSTLEMLLSPCPAPLRLLFQGGIWGDPIIDSHEVLEEKEVTKVINKPVGSNLEI